MVLYVHQLFRYGGNNNTASGGLKRKELEAFLSPLTVQAASPCVWFKRNKQQEVLTRDSTLLNWIYHAAAVVALLFGERVQSFVF